MVFACDVKPGAQEFRDKLRLMELEKMRYEVWSYDEKHPTEEQRLDRINGKLVHRVNILGKHIQGTFSSLRFFKANIEAKFKTDQQFTYVVLDMYINAYLTLTYKFN